MILPYSHEDLRGRRWPLITIALIVINVACLVALDVAMRAHGEELGRIAQQAVAFHQAHPALRGRCDPVASLEAPPPTRRPRARGRAVPLLEAPSDPVEAPDAPEDPAAEAEYHHLCAQLEASLADIPMRRFGYVPADNNLLGLLTYQFLHGGWLHLISNMWFLWLCGCNIEDRWGRAVFVPFYLTAGIAAALTEKLMAPSSHVVLVGASGAIAGAMGAFLVSFAATRIRFVYVIWWAFRVGTFSAPAAFMLPLWLVAEIFWGMIGGDGVAHWAHVGGFVYGAAFAFVLRRTGAEKTLDEDVEKTITVAQDPRIVRAGDLTSEGKPNEALAILVPLARQLPHSLDVQLETLRAAKAAKDPSRERDAYAKLIELYFDMRAPDTAADLFAEMVALGIDRELTRASGLRVADHLAAKSLFDRADVAYGSALHEGIVDFVATRATVAHAKVAARLGKRDLARERFTAARESPFSSPELDAVIDAELARL